MSTKNYSLSFNEQVAVVGDAAKDQYNNLNLNQNHQFSNAKIVQSKNFEKHIKEVSNYDCSQSNDSQAKQNSTIFKISRSRLDTLNIHNDADKKEEERTLYKSSSNSSTLSLHISAYENDLIDATFGDSVDDDKNDAIKKKKEKNVKDFKENSSIVKYAFEMPRQQHDSTSKPEVMQFKASQKLLNVNQEISSNENAATSQQLIHRNSSSASFFVNVQNTHEHLKHST